MRTAVLAVILGIALACGVSAKDEIAKYLDPTTPGLVPELFAPDRLIAYAYGGSFSPDLREFYCTWQDERGSRSRIVGYRKTDEGWVGIVRLGFVATSIAIEPHVSPTGEAIYYTGLRSDGTWIPYVSTRSESGWGRARPLPETINDPDWTPMYFTSTADGTLYFTQVSMSQDRIVRSRPMPSGYASPEPLGDAVNGSGHAAHPFIAPDESFLLFDSPMGEQSTGFDLYISVRRSDGSWSEPRNLIELNTDGQEICASMTPDGAYLLFTRDSRIYWVDARILDPYLDVSP